MVNLMHTVTPSCPVSAPVSRSWLSALRLHWPEYLIEAGALGAFMLSACVFGVLLEHPSSPLYQALQNSNVLRRILTGLAMGATAIAIIRSPWGQRSGAHMNPAITLTFLTLGKVAPWDAFFYILFQFAGGALGAIAAGLLIGEPLQHSAVNYVVTVPGPGGRLVAFIAEFIISALMMATVLWMSNSPRLSRYTSFYAGALVACFIGIEAPLSGMSMNPARTFASAFGAGEWAGLWIYFTAPVAAMLLASILYRGRNGIHTVYCAKLHHPQNQPCIFRCRYRYLHAQ